jgi:hypothetical protein
VVGFFLAGLVIPSGLLLGAFGPTVLAAMTLFLL